MEVLECVPNVSEGRRPAILHRMREAVTHSGARLLDASQDSDHHRAVLTLAGDPDALHGALLALFEVAVESIDLRHHQGVHPRIGAVDVVPFVPLAEDPEAAMPRAVAAARRLGEAVAQCFGIPVFLYGEAHPEGRPLPAIRRGGLEGSGGLAHRMATDPLWRPDWGPEAPHPTAGCVAIGARFFLIAFNVLLATEDLTLARRIARRVRESDGGLPAVKALGVPLASRRQVQVSMNLTDFRQTSLEQAVEAVTREATDLGVEVADTELIGLVPEAALEGYRNAAALADRTIEARLAR
jgi:glutamate formiminotransferase/glutamate formiminotransferase/formiminotetrahydrofolate cyclodeaminase